VFARCETSRHQETSPLLRTALTLVVLSRFYLNRYIHITIITIIITTIIAGLLV
jgi:hypothetical protein